MTVARTLLADRATIPVAGVPFVATTLDAAVAEFVAGAHDHTLGAMPVRLANAYSLAVASADAEYRAVLLGAGINLPDGAPVAWLMRGIRGAARRTSHRVRGGSFFEGVLDRGRAVGLRHYFLGGTTASHELLLAAVAGRYPGAVIAGHWAPPFGPLSEPMIREAVERIRPARPDVIWVSLGTPKQDFAAASISTRLQLPVVGIGAAFDFLSGAMPEAPQTIQRLGLEWVFRLATEPRRLWRRYVFGNVRFLAAVALGRAREPRKSSNA